MAQAKGLDFAGQTRKCWSYRAGKGYWTSRVKPVKFGVLAQEEVNAEASDMI